MGKLFKILAWIVGIFVVLMVLVIVGLKIFFPAEKALQMAVEQGSEMLGRPVTVDDIDISIWGGLGVELVNVTVASPEDVTTETFLKADNVDLKLRLWPLLSGKYRVKRLIIDRPNIVLVKTAEGKTNYDFKAVDSTIPAPAAEQLPTEAKTAAAAVSFEELEINGGQALFRDDSSGLRLEVEGLDLSTMLENPAPGQYLSQGKINTTSFRVILDEAYPEIALALNYKVMLDVNEDHLSVQKADLDVNGLKFEATTEIENLLKAPKARGNVKSDRIAVADLFKLLSEKQQAELAGFDIDGDFSFDADLEYDATQTEDAFSYAGTAVISNMKMSKEDLDGELQFSRALIDFKRDNLRMNIEEGTFDGQPFKGHLVVDDFENPLVNGELGGSINLAFLQPFLPPEDGHQLDGRANFDLKLSGRTAEIRDIDFSGNLEIVEATYNSNLLPEPVESFSVDAYFDNRLVNVRKFAARLASGHINFTGRINNLVPYLLADSAQAQKISPSVDGAMDGELNLGLLNQFLPEKGSPELTGRLAADIKLAGDATSVANFRPRGTLSISGATYTDSLLPEPITDLRAEMRISPDTILVTSMFVKFVSSDVSFAGQLVDPFPYLLPLKDLDRSKVRKPQFLFSLSSQRFDTDKLFPEAVPGSGEGHAVKPPDSISVVILPDIDGRGTLRVDTLIYCRVEFTNIDGMIRIEDRKIECYDVTGDVYTGKVSGTTTIDLSDFEDPQYIGEFNGSQVDVDDFISRFSKFGGHVFGKCDLTGNYSARGWDPDAFLNSLNMTGHGNLSEGKIVTSGAVYSLIKGLADKTGQEFAREQPVRNLSTNITVKDGKVGLDNLESRLANLGDIKIGGFYGFDGSLEYSGTLELSKDLTSKVTSKGGLLGGLAGLLTNGSSERLLLPLKISGTVDKPSADLDYSALTKNAGKKLQDEAGDLLKGLIKKKEN